MANKDAPENDDMQLGGSAKVAQEDNDRQIAAAYAAAHAQAPVPNYAGGDQYGTFANGARGGANDALSMMRDRANGIHTASDATAYRGNALAAANQRSMFMGARGQAAMAGAPQQAAGVVSRMATDNRNNMNITNARDTALAQDQLAQGYGQMRGQDASAQHVYDTRSQFDSDLEARQRAMNDAGQLGYERMAAGTRASRLGAEEALNDAQDQQWSSAAMAHEQAAGLNQQQGWNYAGAGANAGGAGAGYLGSQGISDPGYDYSDPSNGEINRKNPYDDHTSDARAKKDIVIENPVMKYAQRVMSVPGAHMNPSEELYAGHRSVANPLAARIVEAGSRNDGKAGWLEKVSAGIVKGSNRAVDATAQYRPQLVEGNVRPAPTQPVSGGETAASSQMLDEVKPVSFNYKPGFGGPERHYGVLAQDLEKSPMGASLVTPDAAGVKKVDIAKTAMANMAATADLHQRVKSLESGGKIDDNAAKRLEAEGNKMRRSMDAQFAYSDEVVKDDVKREGISPQEAYASRVNELTADAKMGAPEAPQKLDELTARGNQMGMELGTGISGAVHAAAKAGQHNWNVEGELARHNKSLLKAPEDYRNEGAVDISESPNGERILSRLVGRGGKTTVAGVSQDAMTQEDIGMLPANERGAYLRMKAGQDLRSHNTTRSEQTPGTMGSAARRWHEEGRKEWESEHPSPHLPPKAPPQKPQKAQEHVYEGPRPVSYLGMAGETSHEEIPYGPPAPNASYADQVNARVAAVKAPTPGLGSNHGVNNDPHKHDIPLQSTLDAEHAQMQADYEKYKAERDAPQPPMMGIGKKGTPSDEANIPEGMKVGPKGGLVPDEAAVKKTAAVDPDTLTSAPGRQPVDMERGDVNAIEPERATVSPGGTRTVPAHYEDQIGPDAWAALSDAEKSRFTSADYIANRSRDQAHADEDRADEAIGSADRAAIHAGNMQSDLVPRHEDLDAKANDILRSSKDLANYHEDPNHFWGTRSTPQKVAGFIGVLLGGFAQGLRGGQNVALEQLNKAQDDDIAAQRHTYMANRDSLDAKRSAFGMAMERYNGDEKAATAAVRLAQLDKRDAIAMKAAAQHSDTDTMNRLDMFMADSEKLRAEEIIKYKRWVQSRTVNTGPDMNGLLKDYGKYHDAVLEKLHAGEGGTPPLPFNQWVQGRLGAVPGVPEGAVVGPHTTGSKAESDQKRTIIVDGKPRLAVNSEVVKDWNDYSRVHGEADRLMAKLMKAKDGDPAEYDAARAKMIEVLPQVFGYARGPSIAQVQNTFGPEAIPEYAHWYKPALSSRADAKLRDLQDTLRTIDKSTRELTLAQDDATTIAPKGVSGPPSGFRKAGQ